MVLPHWLIFDQHLETKFLIWKWLSHDPTLNSAILSQLVQPAKLCRSIQISYMTAGHYSGITYLYQIIYNYTLLQQLILIENLY